MAKNKKDSKTKYSPLTIAHALKEAETRLSRHMNKNAPTEDQSETGESIMMEDKEGVAVSLPKDATVGIDRKASKNKKERVAAAVGSAFSEVDEVGKRLFTPISKFNQYQVRKQAARTLMDAALMMANISQLRTILELGPDDTHYYYVVLILTVGSLVLQIIFAILMFLLLMRESLMAQKKDFVDHVRTLEIKGLAKDAANILKKTITNEKEDLQHSLWITRLNYVTMFLVFVITVMNMFITGFGVMNKH